MIFLSFIFFSIAQEGVKKYVENCVEVITNSLHPYSKKGEVTTLHLEKEFSIDTARDETQKIGLKSINQFDVDSEGSVYITGPFPRSIFKFNPKGTFLKAIRKQDKTTGEFAEFRHFRISANNQIVAIGRALDDILFFNTNGELIKEIPRSIIQEIPTGIPDETPRDTELWDVWPLENGNSLTLRVLNYYTELDHYCALTLCNAKWKEIKELDHLGVPGFRSDKAKRVKGFFPRLAWSVSKKRIYIGNNENGYEIHVYDLGGRLIRIIKKEYQPVRVPNSYKEYIRKMAMGRPGAEKIYFPDDFPAFQYLFSDDASRLFVMTYETCQDGRGYVYDIFNPDGVFIGRTRFNNYGVPNWWMEGGDAPLEIKAKKDRLYCNQMGPSNKNELVVYKMSWIQ